MDGIANYASIPPDYIWALVQWDRSHTCSKIEVAPDNITIITKVGGGFKSSLGDYAFTPGQKYYCELVILSGSLIKIGVSRKPVDVNQAFSDTDKGWAIYNGELRHSSNGSGPKYGVKLKTGDVVGILLDMVNGVLEFIINGKNYGVAYKDPKLKEGTLYVAAAPMYSPDSIKLQFPLPED